MKKLFWLVISFIYLTQGLCRARNIPSEVRECEARLTKGACRDCVNVTGDCHKHCWWEKEFLLLGNEKCVFNDPSRYAAIYIVIYFLFLFYILNIFWTLELPDYTQRQYKNRRHLYELNLVDIYEDHYWTSLRNYVCNNVPTLGLLMADPAFPISRTTNTILSYWAFTFSLLACIIMWRLDEFDADIWELEVWVVLVVVTLPNFLFPKIFKDWIRSEYDMSNRVSEYEKCYNWACCMPCWYFALRPFGICFKRRIHSCLKILTPLQYWLMFWEVFMLVYATVYIASMEDPYCLFFLNSFALGFVVSIVLDIFFQAISFCIKYRIESDTASSVELCLCSCSCCRKPDLAETRYAPKSMDLGFAKQYTSSGVSPIHVMPLTPEGYVTPLALDPNQNLATPKIVKDFRKAKSEPANIGSKSDPPSKGNPRTARKIVGIESTHSAPELNYSNDTRLPTALGSDSGLRTKSTEAIELSAAKPRSTTGLELTL